jgi:DNA-binding beta-propeller fold protein YncE
MVNDVCLVFRIQLVHYEGMTRALFIRRVPAPSLLLLLVVFCSACDQDAFVGNGPEAIWGQRGTTPGRLQKPRAVAVDGQDRLYIVDMSARIQVFDPDGNLLHDPWQTPVFKNGKPTGLSIDHDGNLMVADTHYFRILFYSPEGKLLEDKTIGGTMGHGSGEFGLVTDVVQDSQGNYYVSEYGDFDRIQKFSPKGEFLLQWGGHGSQPGQFRRPQNMTIDAQDRIWVVDACNHRVQVFDTEGKLVKIWGRQGRAPGELSYPYDLVLDDRFIYICEMGNNRIQKLTHDGRSVAIWGRAGRDPGELYNPWALARDSQGRLVVIDSNNHRVQRIRM